MTIKLGYEMGPEGIFNTINLVKEAEKLGFYSAWMADSQMMFSDVYVALASCAASTSSIRLGTSVTNPVTRHPSVVANAASSLAELSHDRMMIGIARGDSAVYRIGVKPQRVEDFRDSLSLIKALLSDKEYFYHGKMVSLRMGGRKVPLYIAATGPTVLKLAGEVGDGVLLRIGNDASLYKYALDHVLKGAELKGRKIEDVKIASFVSACISENRVEARNVSKYFIGRFLGKVNPKLVNELPLASSGLNEKLVVQATREFSWARSKIDIEADYAKAKRMIPDALIDKLTITGTPEDCIREIKEAEKAGVDQLCLSLQPPKDRLPQLKMLGQSVLPYFK